MSDINLAFTVDQYSTQLTVESTDLTFTPNTNSLNLYLGGFVTPGGNATQIQFNNNGILGGVANTSYASGNLTLGNISNVRITGGSNNYYIKTNGSGTLSFTQPLAAGSNTQLQFNSNGNLAGVAGTSYASGNLTLGSISNVKIGGGGVGYLLRTDGAGNLTFITPPAGGANSQLQFNSGGNLSGVPNVSYANSALSLGNINAVKISGGTANYFMKTDGAGNLSWALPQSTPGGSNTQLQYNNAGVLAGITGTSYANSKLTLGNVANVRITGGFANYVLQTDGTGNLSWVAQTGGNGGGTPGGTNGLIQYNANGAFGGVPDFTYDVANTTIVSAAKFTHTGTLTIQEGKESVIESPTVTGTINYNYLDGAIVYTTGNLTGNLTVNLRGNSTTTFNSVVNNWQTATVVLLTTLGSTKYIPSTFQIDGSTKTVKWINGVAPIPINVYANSIVAYTYTVTRTTLSNYVVFGSFTSYL